MGESFEVRVSRYFPDHAWDQFLESTPQGRIEQTSAWARYKNSEGWASVRLQLLKQNDIVAGCQILTRQVKFFGKIAYITGGPVLSQKHPDCRGYLTHTLKQFCHTEGIFALLAFPTAHEWSDEFEKQQFLPNYVKKVIEGHIVIDLGPDIDEIFRNIKPKKRQNIRSAAKQGVSVRRGATDDLGTFFHLMECTCKRQHTTPNPPDLASVQRIWQLLEARGQAVLFLAEHQGHTLAALMAFNFGNNLLLWKKGWSGNTPSLKVNDFIIWEALRWAKDHRLNTFQDLGINFDCVFSDEERADLGLETRRSSDQFKQSFGGEVQLLPVSSLFIPNVFLRLGYRLGVPLLKKPAVNRYRLHKLAIAKSHGDEHSCGTGF